MDPEISNCLAHMIIVQNGVQCLLNTAAFLISPMKIQYVPTFIPIGLITTLLSIYTISKPRFKLIIWYIIFLLIGFLYRIYVIVDMFLYRKELLKIIKNCDDYDLIDIDANNECDLRLDFKIIALNLINSITFHFVALILDIFLITVSIQLRIAWKHLDEHKLLLLTVQYDKNNQVINKYLKDKYGTFRVIAEDGRLNDEIDFIKGNLLKANYFDNFSDSYDSYSKSFEQSHQSELYKTAEFGNSIPALPFKSMQITKGNTMNKSSEINEADLVKNVETNERINDEIMRNIVDIFVNSSISDSKK